MRRWYYVQEQEQELGLEFVLVMVSLGGFGVVVLVGRELRVWL